MRAVQENLLEATLIFIIRHIFLAIHFLYCDIINIV